jgi:hypothetical protein
MFGHALELDPTANKVVKEFGVMDGGSFCQSAGIVEIAGPPLVEKASAAPTVVIAKNDATEMKNLETDKAAFAAWNNHDIAGADAPNAADMVLHDMTSPKDLSTNAELRNEHIVLESILGRQAEPVVHVGCGGLCE